MRCGVAVVTVCGLAIGGCAQAPAERAGEGSSTHRFVERETAAGTARAVGPGEVRQPVTAVEPPRPILPLAEAVYPEAARGRQSLPATIGLRITVGRDGSVTAVGPSLAVLSWAGAHAAEFHAAAEAAVWAWRFVPAEERRMVPKAGGPDGVYWHVVRVEAVEATLEVEIAFTPSGAVVQRSR